MRMPSRARRACIALPTPQIALTGRVARKDRVSASPIIEKPRGLSRSEASLARNLLWLRPIETEMPISESIRLTKRTRLCAGGPPCRRSVPRKSIKASSIDSGSTSGVRSFIICRTSRPTRPYFSISGGMMMASGQAALALNIGIAECTPWMRAI